MSIFKKFLFQDYFSNRNLSANEGFCTLTPKIQERLARGVKYNLKLIIRGERKSGKSALLSRLKGEEFTSNYIPTDEIKVACILWNYRPTNDAVKIDAWDVVDKGRQKKVKHGTAATGYVSRLTKTSQMTTAVASLDAAFIDVYKGANCVILMFDVTSKRTFEYVRRELPKVPHPIPVLVVGNFRDAATTDGINREVKENEVRAFVRHVTKARKTVVSVPVSDRDAPEYCSQNMCAPIRYCEASMLNGFGLMYIHRFLNIPFLHLQRAYLLQALAINRQDFSTISQQLDVAEKDDDDICSYEKFTRWMERTRGGAPLPSLSASHGVKMVTPKTGMPSAVDVLPSAGHHAMPLPIEQRGRPVNGFPLPEFAAPEDSAFSEFLGKADDSPPCAGGDLKKESVKSNFDASAPVVAALKEDVDLDDAIASSVPGGLFRPGGTAFSHRPLADSADDDLMDEDDDDDDLMNEDDVDDDDEEQLGPALGLDTVEDGRPLVKANDHPQLDKISDFQSLSSADSLSPSTSVLPSPHSPDVVVPLMSGISPSDFAAVDLGTLEERNAFERFLDGT